MLCKICNKEIGSKAMGRHIKLHGLTTKEYYDIYIKSDEEGRCKVCGKPTKFNRLSKGYRHHCSSLCAQTNPETRAKIKQTNLDIYGYTNGNREKCKEVCLDKYGQTSYLATKDCRQQLQDANIKLYGTKTPFESQIIQDKVKQTNQERLGVDYPLSNPNIHNKAQTNKLADINNYAKNNNMTMLVKLTEQYGWGWLYELDIPYSIYKHVALVDNKYLDIIIEYSETHPIIPKVSKYTRYNSGGKTISKREEEIFNYIKEIYNGDIIKNTRKIIAPMELDLYIPKLKLAIEYNGIYWHSIKHKPKSYHYNKSIMCKNLGIRLLHIYEFETLEEIKQQLYNIINNLEVIDISKPCNLDKDNWKLYEQIGQELLQTGPIKILDFPEIWGSGNIIYKPL